jgi:hypothetical protein
MSKIKMPSVRLSYPSLFQTEDYKGTDTEKYAATFILDKTDHKDIIKKIQKRIKTVIKESLKGKTPSDEKICLKDGDDTDKPELEGAYSIKATTRKRPVVLDRDKTPVTQSDNIIYAGCMVNGIITIWGSENYGRVSAGLEGLQFAGEGEPFGSPTIDVDEFDVFGEADDNDDVVNY